MQTIEPTLHNRDTTARRSQALGLAAKAVAFVICWLFVLASLFFALPSASAAPANDDCSNAIVVFSVPFTNTQSTVGATNTGDPIPSCAIDFASTPHFGSGVWYKYTAVADGALFVDSFGSDFDTIIGVYSGVCGSLTEAGCNDDVFAWTNGNSRAAIRVSTGVPYYILVGGYNAAAGNLVLHVSFTNSVLPNDQCSGAHLILGTSYTNTQSTATATSSGDPAPDCVATFGNGLWYRYSPPAPGSIVVDT